MGKIELTFATRFCPVSAESCTTQKKETNFYSVFLTVSGSHLVLELCCSNLVDCSPLIWDHVILMTRVKQQKKLVMCTYFVWWISVKSKFQSFLSWSPFPLDIFSTRFLLDGRQIE